VRPPACGQAGGPADLPEQALALGRWVKWIGGASNQDLAAIEDLAGLYCLAGVHCLDLAADAAVVEAARRGIAWAQERGAMRPWLMVSLSDGPDPHFRKAWFDPVRCPPDCPRPCERVCPAMAIPPLDPASAGRHNPASSTTADPAPGSPETLPSGVLADRCYGCGRCLPACPQGLIVEREQILPAAAVPQLLAILRPDAIELHTRIGRSGAFAARLAQVREADIPLRRLAVSCGLEVEAASGSEGRKGVEPPKPDEQRLASELWNRFAQVREAGYTPLWQLDGRPMSGDVGAGTARAAVGLLRRLADALPPGPVQLAGGTNDRTLALVEALSPSDRARVAGVAFGSVARARLAPLLLEAQRRGGRLLDQTDLLPQACALAGELVEPWLRRSQ
jgi:Fe-S-cluster-containing hydrogenase component 2